MNKKIERIKKKLEEKGFNIKDSNNSRKGGNGQILFVEKEGKNMALKVIEYSENKKKKKRTIREIEILKRECDIEGLLPIFESEINKNFAWYTMPIAKPLNIKDISEGSIEDIILKLKSLAQTLKELHDKNIAHRDIKPENLLMYNERICLSDFGLVIYPGANKITKEYDKVGPWTTIAPEQKRNPRSGDPRTSDIYSFAKTIWILLTGEEKCFDGQYSYKDSSIRLLTYRTKFSDNKKPLAILDEILTQATENNPEKRQTIDSIIKSLDNFLNFSFSELVNNEWNFVAKNLFPYGIPTTTIWTNYNEIANILKQMTYFKNINHLFFSSGGLDLTDVTLSNEPGFIELHFDGFIHKLKPKALIFEVFNDSKWNYFLLDIETIDVKINNETIVSREIEEVEVIEITPGKYIPNWCSFYGRNMTGNEKTLFNTETRHISIVLSGKYLLCNKRGPYNKVHNTYNGYQSFFNIKDFRKFILLCLKDKIYFKIANEIVFSKSTIEEKKLAFQYLIEEINDQFILDLLERKDTDIEKSHKKKILSEKEINSILSLIDFNCIKDDNLNIYSIKLNFNTKSISDEKSYIFDKNNNFKKLESSFFDFLSKDKKIYINKESIECIIKQIKEIFHNKNIDFENFSYQITDIQLKHIPKFKILSKMELDNILRNGNSFVQNTLIINSEGDLKLLPTKEYKEEIKWSPIQINKFPSYENSVGEFYNYNNILEFRYNECLNYYFQFLNTLEMTYYVDWYLENDEILKKLKDENMNID